MRPFKCYHITIGMKRLFILFFIFSVGFSVNDVQRELITIDWKLTAKHISGKKGRDIITFEGADYGFDNPEIPVLTKSYQLLGNEQNFQFCIEKPDLIEFGNDSLLSFSDDIGEEVQIESTKLKSGDFYSVQVKILPIVKKDNKIYLVKSFELKKIPVLEKSAVIASYVWQGESVLKSGKWIKIKTSGKGIYKIPYTTLSGWGFSNPSQVSVFGSGGTILSENPGVIQYDDLKKCAVWQAKNNGVDCLFFYEPGNVEWEPDQSTGNFEHTQNIYSNSGYFFLSENSGPVKIATKMNEIQAVPTHLLSAFDEYDLFEKEELNLLRSGRQWFSLKLNNGLSYNYDFSIKDIGTPNSVRVRVNTAARSYETSKMSIFGNQVSLGEIGFSSVNTNDNTSLWADERESVFNVKSVSNTLKVGVKYEARNDNALAWLDFVEINYKRKLKLTGGQLFFRDLSSLGEGNVAEFTIEGVTASTRLFDVTDVNNIIEIPLTITGNTAKARRPANELREYVVFNPDGTFLEPENVGEVENQNLHGMNTPTFLIITHSNFADAANVLANFHRSYDNMNVEVVSAEKIYNEFSSGIKSATGIRNFIKMFYDRGNTLKYVLLFGDGSYDNKNIKSGNLNFIPTFQSENSLNPVASFVTDDYFVILDNNESVYNGAVDLGIGRIPASTKYQAEVVVDKIQNYNSTDALGNWRNVVCFIADDEDGNLHMSDSEKLANQVNSNHKEFITDKIYLDAYVQETATSGEAYPDVTEAINSRVNDGVLVLNYVGHANERYLADEHVLDVSNINSWSNAKKLPIFVTATCEFSRFDDDETSAGEYVLFNANGGGIGLFSTTRIVFAYSNFLLSKSFYDYIFQRDGNGEHYRMGDIMRLAKINTINTTNKRNFSLLTDPALRLSYPQYQVVTSTINQKNATESSDTIGALQKVTITGYISDYTGKKLDNFTGELIPTVYDKAITMKTLGNAGQKPMSFKVQENIIYKGVASVDRGNFTFSFVIPKDISYNLGNGKIVYYASNGTTDAHGAFENFVIGGSGSQIADNNGPQIDLYLDSENFVSGDKTSKNPMLLAFLSDESGINTVGTGIGHDITAVLDGNNSEVMVLNGFYRASINDYKSGVVQFPLKNITAGRHSLKLKAWDVANNSSEAEIEFVVSGDFIISGVSCYPNPMNEYTFFTFEHNLSGATLDVIVEIFDYNGRRVGYKKTVVGSGGTVSNSIRWGLDDMEVLPRSGLYVYRIVAQNNEGIITSKSGKLMISN